MLMGVTSARVTLATLEMEENVLYMVSVLISTFNMEACDIYSAPVDKSTIHYQVQHH